MMPIVLVLLAVTSALAAPSVSLTAYNINEVGVPRNVVERAFELVDGGSTDVYSMLLQQTIIDMASQPDASSQALGATQALVTLAYLSTTLPGDACAATAMIDAYVYAVGSGNFSGLRPVLANFFQRVGAALEYLVRLTTNPESLRNAVGPGSGCAGGGRSFPVEAAWDAILSSQTPYTIGLYNEQYCAVKRLSTSYSARSNAIASAVTALALPPCVQVLSQAGPAISNLMSVVARGGNPSQPLAVVKQALSSGASKVKL